MTENAQVLKYIKKSFELKNQGFYKPAIEMLYKAIALDCDNLEIMLQLAHVYKLLNNFERAIYYIEKVLEINENHKESLSLLEEIYLTQKDFGSALKVSEKNYKIESTFSNLAKKINILNKLNDFESIKSIEESETDKNDEVLYELAIAYCNQGDLSHSIRLLEAGCEKNNKNLNIILLLAKNYYKNNDFDKSKNMFKKLEEISPTPEIFNYLGLFELNKNDYLGAIDYFAKACKQDVKNAEYNYNLATAFFLNGWLDEALKYFNNAICFDANNIDYHYSLAYLFYQKGLYNKSLLELKLIKKLNPAHNLSKTLEAMIIAKKGDLLTAKFSLEEIIKSNDTDDFAHYALSQVYKELSQIEPAMSSIEKAMDLNPYSLEYLSEAVELEIKLNKYDKALELTDKIININEKFINAYTYKAKIYFIKENYDKLYDVSQEIIELDSNTFEGYYYNALALFNQGDKDFAIESLKKAISLNLNNAELYAAMSTFYQELGNFQQAYEWAKEAVEIDGKNYKYNWLCARLATVIKNEKEAGKFFSQSYRLASFDKDLCKDYAKYLKSIGKEKQSEKILNI